MKEEELTFRRTRIDLRTFVTFSGMYGAGAKTRVLYGGGAIDEEPEVGDPNNLSGGGNREVDERKKPRGISLFSEELDRC